MEKLGFPLPFRLPAIHQPQPANFGAEASSLCTTASVEVTQAAAQAPASTEVTVQCTKPTIQTTESASYYQSQKPSLLKHGSNDH